MIVIDKAILHILDFNSGMTVFSDEELTVENSIETFLLKHIEKSMNSQDAKEGKFYEDSECKKTFAGLSGRRNGFCSLFQGNRPYIGKSFAAVRRNDLRRFSCL